MKACIITIWSVLGTFGAAAGADVEMPVAADPRVAIDLFAAEPDIVTPTGIAVDAQGRVLCIESQTHFRPKDYAGPPADRIRMFEDTDGDGRADRISTFFEGTVHTMNLAVYPPDLPTGKGASRSHLAIAHGGPETVYVATRREIFRLRDTDGDGKADERTQIARLDTPGDYPHNGLSGFAFDFDGNVYFGLGENLGAPYTLTGSDGTTYAGGGEGGNIYRCQPDGRGLTQIATGFWNPFNICFDTFGRLFAVDNDPDSRPPCRLLHIVPGGDYGYRFRNGRKGLHPFTAWNGELPGTLPMVAGTGEAPSGVLAYESDALPADYLGTLLVTSWGDHRIDRFRLEDHGASFRALPSGVVTGGENFRPVGIALAPDGKLYVSDWVDKSYELHGKGRIWRIRAREAKPVQRPEDSRVALRSVHRPLREHAARQLAGQRKDGLAVLRQFLRDDENERVRAVALAALLHAGIGREDLDRALADRAPAVRAMAARGAPAELLDPAALARADASSAVRFEAIRRIGSGQGVPLLLETLDDEDPFLRHAARTGLAHASGVEQWLAWLNEETLSPRQRVNLLLLLRASGDPKALEVLPALLGDADPTVRFSAVQWIGEQRLTALRPRLVDGLSTGATTRELFEAYLTALGQLDGIERTQTDELGAESYVAEVLNNPQTPLPLRRRALRVLRPDHPSLSVAKLRELLALGDVKLQLEAVRTLRDSPQPQAQAALAEIAGAAAYATSVRAEAVVGLHGDDPEQRPLLIALAAGDEPVLREEALRSLQGATLSNAERFQVASSRAPGELIARVVGSTVQRNTPPPQDVDAWLAQLEGDADPAAGERIFFHPKGPGCYRCHEIDGRGGRIGPDLSSTGRVLTRKRLVESILQPSKEIAPQFVPWTLLKTDGSVLAGMLVGENATGEQTYATQEGKTFTVHRSEIEQREPSKVSIMPDGVEQTMTLQEFRDLLAYLQSRR